MLNKFILCLALTISIVLADATADKVDAFPGIGANTTTDIYSGYLNANEAGSKRLHYVYVFSQNDPTTDPVVVWFNGGPGCSSLLGFISENGPYKIDDNSTVGIQNNTESWNKYANVLYIESPAGVGFSVGDTWADNQHNDMS